MKTDFFDKRSLREKEMAIGIDYIDAIKKIGWENKNNFPCSREAKRKLLERDVEQNTMGKYKFKKPS